MTTKEQIAAILDSWDLNAVADDKSEREQLINELTEVFPEKNNEAIFYVLFEVDGKKFSRIKHEKNFTYGAFMTWIKSKIKEINGTATDIKIIRP